jgi:GDP/UDP-N,N'-diacetylbacillosamine 2-epimerase (hydrolysing)
MKKKKIIAVTGIRSEYDILYPIIKELNEDQNFELKLVLSGAHLSSWHGNFRKIFDDEGFKIADSIDSLLTTNRNTQRIKGIGLLTTGLAQTVEREEPDILFVIGDREESIATALVGNYMNVLVAHYGGGDTVFGNADDPIRFAVSKLAHIHFTGAKEYAQNLQNIGEEEFRIFNVGNPAYDNIINTQRINLTEISNYLNFDITNEKYIVLLKHPLSSEKDQTFNQMEITLKSIEKFCKEFGYKVIGIYPNTDPGSYDILNVINNYQNSDFIKFFKNIPTKYFVNIMRNCKALVGNSSMGILEAPFYKIPVVNIGNRQKGRLNAGNVFFVDYDLNLIIDAIKNACLNISYREQILTLDNPFGNGNSSKEIVQILTMINLDDKKWHIKKKLC